MPMLGDALLLMKKKPIGAPMPDETSPAPKDEPQEQDGDSDKADQEDAAIDEMLKAARKEDVQGFKDNLKAFLSICYPSLEDEDEDETEQEQEPSEE